ncbi:hypothetical protein NUW58_g7781 [Xylaria curta]|uniref:Uncharacterized protein n=1 Tax=Xylaria curta TaxID=42375 RepID=A0ACC1NEQ7_9PEZI|nr:hypothetical protein NUW58_g7781 [Xylaria curta]
MSFPFNQLPPELRLEIWSLAMQVDARRRRVVEQSFHVFPTLDLVASPLFAVNAESREAARAFYPVRLEVYRRPPPGSEPPPQYGEDTAAAQQLARDDDDYRGCVYLSPALDDLVSVFNRATLGRPGATARVP